MSLEERGGGFRGTTALGKAICGRYSHGFLIHFLSSSDRAAGAGCLAEGTISFWGDLVRVDEMVGRTVPY